MTMQIEIAKDYDDLGTRTARFLCDFIEATAQAVIALPVSYTHLTLPTN